MSDADIRAVAADIRAKAEPMLTGAPWTDHHGAVAMRNGSEIASHMGMLASAHMSAWDPAVAFAVADWLDAVANNYGDAAIDRCAQAFVKAWRGAS